MLSEIPLKCGTLSRRKTPAADAVLTMAVPKASQESFHREQGAPMPGREIREPRRGAAEPEWWTLQ